MSVFTGVLICNEYYIDDQLAQGEEIEQEIGGQEDLDSIQE